MADPRIDTMARAICQENCAFYGEPPCWHDGEWPYDGCDSPGCIALATASLAALASHEGETK